MLRSLCLPCARFQGQVNNSAVSTSSAKARKAAVIRYVQASTMIQQEPAMTYCCQRDC